MPKRTFQPNKRKKLKKNGFLSRMATKKGAQVIKRRRKAGRKSLSSSGRVTIKR